MSEQDDTALQPGASETTHAPYAETPHIPEVCGNCQHWRHSPSNPSFGQCLRSMKALPSPLVTTDRGSCTQWAAAARLTGLAAGNGR